MTKLSGELATHGDVNVTNVTNNQLLLIQNGLVKALALYPDARDAVVRMLEELDAEGAMAALRSRR